MTRGVLVLSSALVVVVVLGVCVTGSRSLSDRELAVIVGGTESYWCNTGCTNCSLTSPFCMEASANCTTKNVPCPQLPWTISARCPEVCDPAFGDGYCEGQMTEVQCLDRYDCICREVSPEVLMCVPINWTISKTYARTGANCTYDAPSGGEASTLCDM
jgi:hypothetical protein